jgi:hypothetical protein
LPSTWGKNHGQGQSHAGDPYLIRLGATVLVCAGLSACAAGLLPAMVAPQLAATVAVAGLSAASCTGNSSCEQVARPCASQTDKKLEVTEAIDIDIPASEGKVASFTPAYWQSEFVSQGASVSAAAVEPAAGTFAITDKSIVFVPAPGIEGVRLPLVGVLNVELQQSSTTGAARQLTVESCFGRLDRFTFGQTQNARQLDSKATADAPAEIKSRIAAARTPAKK